MTKKEAIKKYKEITSGAGVDRDKPLDVIKRGNVAEMLWNESAFTLGIEYGFLIALVEIFNISENDLSAAID